MQPTSSNPPNVRIQEELLSPNHGFHVLKAVVQAVVPTASTSALCLPLLCLAVVASLPAASAVAVQAMVAVLAYKALV